MKIFYLIIFFFSCSSLYSQTRIDGTRTVNPAKSYVYRGYLPGIDILTDITWKVVNGRFNNPDGPTSLTQGAGAPIANVVWDDAETGKLYITINSILYVGIDVEIQGVKKMHITDFKCNGLKVTDDFINIPLGETGTLNFSVPDMPYGSGTLTTFQWTTPKSWGGSTFTSTGNISVKYDASSGNNEVISVTPVGFRGVLGNTKRISIKRTTAEFNGNIINTTISSNKTYEHSNLYLQGVVVKSGANVVFNGYNSVRIVPGFTAELGSTVRIYNGARTRSSAEEDDYIINGGDKTALIDKSVAKIEQNYPNPAKEYTNIQCFIPESSLNSFVHVYNMMGNLIMKIPVFVGHENIHIDTSQMVQGMYVFSLIIDGKLIDSKRMIVNK